MATALDQVTLRTYRPADFAEVWSMHVDALRELGYRSDDEPAPWDADLRDIPETYLQPGSHFWVAASPEGDLVGCAAVRRVDERTADLRRMRVRHDWRRRGLGERLLLEAERFCRACGYRRVVLDAMEHMEAAQALYRKHGYAYRGRERIAPGVKLFFAKELG